jgi:hypothetical protein
MTKTITTIAAAAIALTFAMTTASHAGTVKVAGNEELPLGSWAITLPDANVPACAPADLKKYYAVQAHNLAALHNGGAIEPTPSGCTMVDGGTKVQIIEAAGDAVCIRKEGESAFACRWTLAVGIESIAAYDRDKQETQSIRDTVNRVFDRQHPECKHWRSNKDLPDYCY